jgi:zinc/manganese transport system substrate-binding protein
VTSTRAPVGFAVLVLAVALVAGACASGTRSLVTGPGEARRIEVVAAENFWGSIAAQLGGDHVELVSIVANPETDPHDYEPTAADARTVAQAGYVIENGVGYDPWASRLVAATQASDQTVLDVGRFLHLHVGDNPHRWYFPDDVARVVDRITADYQAIDPADAAYFGRRRDDFVHTDLARYHRLLTDIRQRWAGTPVGASESIFEGLAEATGLRLVTPSRFLEAVSEGSDPTAADKATVDDQIAHHEIRVFVFNSQNATPDIRALVDAAHAHHIPVSTITETLAPANVDFETWQSIQLAQLGHALAKGTGA